MSILQFILCIVGTFFLICAFADWKKTAFKFKNMKLDPDWIDFFIGSVLLLLVFSFMSFFAYDLLKML